MQIGLARNTRRPLQGQVAVAFGLAPPQPYVITGDGFIFKTYEFSILSEENTYPGVC